MTYQESFLPLSVDDLLETSKKYKEEGYRLAQIHPVLKLDDSISLYYTFVRGGECINLHIDNIKKDETVIPSVTPLFISAFVFENEAHDLFGVNIEGNLIDFQGAFYSFGEGITAPMTIITPEQLAAREKAAKIAKAKAAKEAKLAKEKAEAKASPTTEEKGE